MRHRQAWVLDDYAVFVARNGGSFDHGGVQSFADALKAAGQTVEYVQVEGAGHAFFDWKPDGHTKATFAKYGVPYAAKMKSFFDRVFYPQGRTAAK